MSNPKKEKKMTAAIYVSDLDRDTVQEFADKFFVSKGQIMSYLISLMRSKKIDINNFYSKLD